MATSFRMSKSSPLLKSDRLHQLQIVNAPPQGEKNAWLFVSISLCPCRPAKDRLLLDWCQSCLLDHVAEVRPQYSLYLHRNSDVFISISENRLSIDVHVHWDLFLSEAVRRSWCSRHGDSAHHLTIPVNAVSPCR